MNNVKKSIGWADYTVNPVRGLCPVGCSYCYARRHYQRFHLKKDGAINPTWDYTIRMEPDWMEELPKKPCRIFVGSTMELFGDWVEDWMWDSIWQYVNDYPQHTFIFLTKKPENLIKWSFPNNAWIGASATDETMFYKACIKLKSVKAKVKFISFEPLLRFDHLPIVLDKINWICTWLREAGISWVIIGQQTPASAKTAPKIEWIKEIVEAADKAGVPVFLKNNLSTLFVRDSKCQDEAFQDTFKWALRDWHTLRQELPK